MLNVPPNPTTIINNIDFYYFSSRGFSVVYNYTYSHVSQNTEFLSIRNTCGPFTTLCMAGQDSKDGLILTAACGNCYSIISNTTLNQPNYINGAYWYYTP